MNAIVFFGFTDRGIIKVIFCPKRLCELCDLMRHSWRSKYEKKKEARLYAIILK